MGFVFNGIEAIGLMGSLFIVISSAQKSVIKLRLINSVGCILFLVYGFIIGSISTIVVNTIGLICHVYYLIKIFKKKKNEPLINVNNNFNTERGNQYEN